MSTVDKETRSEKELKNIKEELEKLNSNIEKIAQKLANISKITKATGLNLSNTTLKNLLKVLQNNNNFEKFNPEDCEAGVFKELLDVDISLATNIQHFFWYNRDNKKNLKDIKGINEKIIKKLKLYFNF